MQRYLHKLLGTLTIAFFSAAMCCADSISPGGTNVPFTMFSTGSFSGPALASKSDSFSLTGADGTVATGTYAAAVYSDANTNGLDFLYQVTSDSSSMDSITNVSMGNFLGFSTNVGYLTDGFGVFSTPGTIIPTGNNRNPTGSTVGFNLLPNYLSGGTTSAIFVIATNASSFSSGAFNIKDDGVASVAAYAPSSSTSVPEPSSIVLFSTGLFGLAGLLRRNRKTGLL